MFPSNLIEACLTKVRCAVPVIYIQTVTDIYLTAAYTFIQYKTVYSKSVNNTTGASENSEIPFVALLL